MQHFHGGNRNELNGVRRRLKGTSSETFALLQAKYHPGVDILRRARRTQKKERKVQGRRAGHNDGMRTGSRDEEEKVREQLQWLGLP